MLNKVFDGAKSLFNPVETVRELGGQVLNIADQFVTDKDALHQINFLMKQIDSNVYMQELNTKTIPWVDALHKMSRPIISMTAIVLPFALLAFDVEIPPEMLLTLGPAGIYNIMKGRGK